jgi:hypothetical protein
VTPSSRAAMTKKATDDLQMVILDVLAEACERGECLGAAEIGRRAGMDRLPAGGKGGTINWNDGLGTHLLNKMLKLGLVQRCPLDGKYPMKRYKRGWHLPDQATGTK